MRYFLPRPFRYDCITLYLVLLTDRQVARPRNANGQSTCSHEVFPLQPTPHFDPSESRMGSPRGGVEVEQDRKHHAHYPQRPQRPCQPGCGAVAYPTDSSTLFARPFCHNPTLPHYRLPSVTTTVTKIALSQSEPNFPRFASHVSFSRK
jgi:hypothetical protein